MHACLGLLGTEFSVFTIPKVPLPHSWGHATAPRPISYHSFPWAFNITRSDRTRLPKMKIKMAQNTVWRIPTRFFVLGLGSSWGGSWHRSRLLSPGLDVSFHVFFHPRSPLSPRCPPLTGCSGGSCPRMAQPVGKAGRAWKAPEAEPLTSSGTAPSFQAGSLPARSQSGRSAGRATHGTPATAPAPSSAGAASPAAPKANIDPLREANGVGTKPLGAFIAHLAESGLAVQHRGRAGSSGTARVGCREQKDPECRRRAPLELCCPAAHRPAEVGHRTTEWNIKICKSSEITASIMPDEETFPSTSIFLLNRRSTPPFRQKYLYSWQKQDADLYFERLF